jgi:hypothetical protein
MKEKIKGRSRWLTVRLSQEEEEKLRKFCNRTTARSLSEYARDVLLKEPVRVLYRNASADQFLSEMIGLKRELNSIGNNFNQAVHKLHTLDHDHQIKAWAMINESSKRMLLKKVDEIGEKLSQIYQLWLQK